MSLTNNTLQKISWFKRIVLFLGSLLILLIALVIALPSILSSKAGTKWLCKELSRQKGIELSIETLSLHWFGPQVATQINGSYIKKKLTFSGERVESSASLWELLFQNNFQQMIIQSPHISLETPLIPPSVWIYQKQPTHKAGMVSDWQLGIDLLRTPWKGSLQLENGSLLCKDPVLEPITFDQISCNLELQQEISGSLNARTLQGKESGSVSLKLSLQPSNDCQIQLSLHNLPTKGLDQCASLFFPQHQGFLPALVGSSLNVEAQLLSHGDLINLHFDVLSSLCEIHIDGKSSSSLFSLTKPAQVSCKLSPDLVPFLTQMLPSLKTLTLTDPISVQINVPSLQCQLPFQGWQSIALACEASLSSPLSGTWEGAPFRSNLLSLKLESPELQSKLSASFNALLQLGSTQGSLNANCNLSSPFSKDRTGSMQCNGTQFPLSILSAWGINSALLLGDTADMSLAIDLEGALPEIKFSWQSSKLQIPSTALSLTPIGWQLTSPLTFAYDLDVKLLPETALILSQITPIQGTIHTFAFSEDHLDQIVLNADLSCKEALFTGAISEKVSNLKATLDIQSCQKISLQVKSDSFLGSIAGALNPYEKTFQASSPLSLQYTLTRSKIPSLIDPCPVQMTIEPFTLSFSKHSLQSLKGQLFLPKLGIQTNHLPLYLQDNASTFQWNGSSQRLDLQFTSQILSTVPGSMQGKCSFFSSESGKPLQMNNLSVDGSLQLRSVSSELLALLSQTPSLPSLLGEAINADCEFASFPQESNLQINWTSPFLNFQTAWTINKEGWTLTTPTNVNFVWTAQNSKTSLLELQEDLPLSLSLSKCIFPVNHAPLHNSFFDRFPAPVWNWNTLECTANLNFSHLKGIDPSSHDGIEIASCNVDFYKPPSNAPIDLKLDALFFATPPSGKKEGSIVLSLKVAPDAKIGDLANSAIDLKLDAKQFPTLFLDLIAKSAGKNTNYSNLLGKSLYCTLDASIKELSGPLSCEINTPTTQFYLSGQLMKGALVLDAPLHAQFSLTEKSSQALLKSVNPLDLSAIYSQNPVTLTLMPDRFYLPLFPWKAELCNIPKASLELGKIRCKNEGNVNIALNLLKSPSSNGNQLGLWFAPLDFSIQNGIATIERTEILLSDAFDVCLFGKLDLVQNNVDMTLGLTAQALARAFGIKGLPKDYVLTIPMKGKLDDVQINSGKATAKVGLLLAWQHKVLQGAVKGPAGAIANELLGAMATLPDANAKIPPPKHPFPWEQTAGEPSPAKKSKKKMFKTSDKPLKQIMKVIK